MPKDIYHSEYIKRIDENRPGLSPIEFIKWQEELNTDYENEIKEDETIESKGVNDL